MKDHYCEKLKDLIRELTEQMNAIDKGAPDIIFHYTSIENALKILKFKEFWFTNYEHLGDGEELKRIDKMILNLDNIYKPNKWFKKNICLI